MTKIGLGQFIVIGFLAVLAGIAAGANGTYKYNDDFSTETEKARTDSCIQSRFWMDRATPPPGPYLYYLDDGRDRQLVFMGYQDQLAELGYCFGDDTDTQRATEGSLTVEVSFPSTAILSQEPAPGQLQYSVSSDGIVWSPSQWLEAGRHEIPLESPTGTVYVRFSGTRVAIDRFEVSLSSPAATISVPETFTTIQAAVNEAVDGDIIEVSPGEYSGRGNNDIDFGGKAITLRSAAGPLHTIINVGAGRRGFHFRSGEGAGSVVSGFTIRNAHLPNGNGGGIYCEFSGPTITNCIIENCTAVVGGGIGGLGAAPTIIDSIIRDCSATTYGGAIGLLDQSDAAITRCEITDSDASYGGGVYVSDSLALIGGSRIFANGATVNGGGVYSVGALTDATFRNCVIAANSADIGAGIYTGSTTGSPRGRMTVNHCTIADNWAQQAGGVYSTGTDFFMTNSIVWGNGNNPVVVIDSQLYYPITFSNIQGGGHLDEDNLNEDPLFANPAAGDYHLQSVYGRYDPQRGWVSDGRNSPCIDAGDPGSSAAAEPAPNGGRVNMGAYGATRQASKSVEHTVWHVDTYGGRDGNNRGRSQAQAFRTIGYALDMAQSGDTILIWPGVYQEELVFDNKAVTLRSAADAAILEAPDAYAYAVSFYHAESSRSILANFVIRRYPVGAIYISGASPTLRNLTIVKNGVGVYVGHEGGEPTITNCIFWRNGINLFDADAYFSYVHGEPNVQARNIGGDPLFADPLNDDFHLKSQYGRYVPEFDTWVMDNMTSPCIDAGNPQDYFVEAEIEPNGAIINMGAYGGTPYASKSRN